MTETLSAPAAFPPAVRSAVEDAAAAFFYLSGGLVRVPEEGEPAHAAGIMSTISFVGDLQWAFALALPAETAVSVARAFAGFDIPFDGPDMGDVVGEIANVIAGDAVGRLAKGGVTVQMSLPTTVRGEDVAVLVPSGASAARFTFAGPEGACWFHLLATPAPAGSPAPPRPVGATTDPAAADAPPAEPAKSEPPAPGVKPPSAEALAAWAEAEAEAERQLAEQDAAEAALRAAGGPAPLPSGVAVAPAGPVAGRGHRLLYLAVVFACGGWGSAAGILLTSARPAKVAAAGPPAAHAGAADEHAPPAPAARVDALIRDGKFADGLKQCLAAPKDAPGLSGPALALREAVCLEGLGRWVEAATAYEKAAADPDAAGAAVALLGQARAAARDGSFAQARTLTNRVLLRSGHPRLRGLAVREEVRHLRARIDRLASGAAPPPGDPPARASLSASPSNGFEWLAAAPAPTPTPGRAVLEVHRTLDAPGALQVTAYLPSRPAIATLRALAATAGWKVQVSDAGAALLGRETGPVEVDHLPLAELLDVLAEEAGTTWAARADTLLLGHPAR